MKNDVYQIVTDRIVRLLESGNVPWHRPWKGGDQWPQNFVSRKVYRGINLFLLNAANYPSPFWLTFKQVQALGGQVKKGERSFPVIFWKVFQEEVEGETKRIPFLRYHNVFNIAQCEGIHVPAIPTIETPFEPIAKCEEVVSEMPKRPTINHHGARACYSPALDTVSMPESKLFESSEGYYSTLFHELIHSTGHVSRLNRKEITDPIRFGSDPYSREELVAEMGAAFLCGHCAIENKTIDQSAGYIQSWLGKLKEDRKLVVHAAVQAQRACDFILDIELGEEEEGPTEPQPKESGAVALRESHTSEQLQTNTYPEQAANYRNTSVKLAPKEKQMDSRSLKIEEDGDAWAGKMQPKIRLKGHWLERAGFKAGNHVSVKSVAPGLIELRSNDSALVLNEASQ